MAQFKAIDPGVEVNLDVVLSFINAVMKNFKPIALEILEKNGIKDPKPGEWCSQQKWLDALKSISEEIGEATLYKVGVVIPENTKSKPGYDKMFSSIQDLRAGLESIDIGYHMTHRGGDIGHYKLVEYNEDERYAIMECNEPNPTSFNRGLITGFVRMFKPEDSFEVKVELDETKPSKLNGDNSDTFKITW
jgi:hypothetical protein